MDDGKEKRKYKVEGKKSLKEERMEKVRKRREFFLFVTRREKRYLRVKKSKIVVSVILLEKSTTRMRPIPGQFCRDMRI